MGRTLAMRTRTGRPSLQSHRGRGGRWHSDGVLRSPPLLRSSCDGLFSAASASSVPYNDARRISGTVRIREVLGGAATTRASVATIWSTVTRPRRSAVLRVEGVRSAIQ